MKHDSPRQARRMPRVPPFYPAPVRTSREGWTVQRQTDFLGMLAETGSVVGACEAVGMSRRSAYALRARPGAESFAAAWDATLGAPARKVTVPGLDFLARHGLAHGFISYELSLLALAWIMPLLTRTVAGASGLPLGLIVMMMLYVVILRQAAMEAGVIFRSDVLAKA